MPRRPPTRIQFSGAISRKLICSVPRFDKRSSKLRCRPKPAPLMGAEKLFCIVYAIISGRSPLTALAGFVLRARVFDRPLAFFQPLRELLLRAIGFVGFGQISIFNLPIRTIIARENYLSHPAGGGIIIDSSAHNEYEEMMDKVRALLNLIKEKEK